MSYVLFGDLTEDDSLSCSCRSVMSYSSCLTLCSMSGFPVLHHLPELAQTHVHCVSDAIHHLDLCHPLLLLSSIFPSLRVFSNESGLCIRWLKYWSFSIIPFRIGFLSHGLVWSPCSPRDYQVFSNTTFQKHQFYDAQSSLRFNSHIHTWLLEKR